MADWSVDKHTQNHLTLLLSFTGVFPKYVKKVPEKPVIFKVADRKISTGEFIPTAEVGLLINTYTKIFSKEA